MKKYLYILTAFIALAIVSCSESDGDVNEFDNWKERNDKYFESIYQKASLSIKSGSNSWLIFKTWTKNEDVAKEHTDNIVVEVLKNGEGIDSPLYTDSLRVHYDGRLMPTTIHPDGYSFQCTWTGEYNEKTMLPVNLAAYNLVDGFTTAIMHMHIGDRWRVYIPYELGYGNNAQSSIPAYSTIIFDLTLHSFSRPGTIMPPMK